MIVTDCSSCHRNASVFRVTCKIRKSQFAHSLQGWTWNLREWHMILWSADSNFSCIMFAVFPSSAHIFLLLVTEAVEIWLWDNLPTELTKLSHAGCTLSPNATVDIYIFALLKNATYPVGHWLLVNRAFPIGMVTIHVSLCFISVYIDTFIANTTAHIITLSNSIIISHSNRI